jgi:hypothetical protein
VFKARRLFGDWDVLSAVAIVVIALGAGQLVGGALTTGLEQDEPIHQDRAVAWLENGWYVPTYWQAGGEPDPAQSGYSTPWVYGPATAALGHAVNVIVGNEPWDYVEQSTAAYEVRHLVNVFLALLAVAAVGAAAWLLTRSRTLGLWTAAALLAVPRFVGHAFVNPKDIAAASGYTLLVVALLFALLEEPGKPPSRRRTIGIAAGVAFGIAIAAGTRTALWLPFAIALGTYAALRVGQSRLGGIARDKGTDIVVAAAAVIGFVAIAALYPNVSSQPVDLLVESVFNSADYYHSGTTLTAGGLVSVANPPFWYVPAWVGATYPLLLGALALLGSGAGIWALAKARGAVWGRRELGLLLVLQQAFLLPIAVILAGSPAYNGIRQHLYMFPALTILAGFGAWLLLCWARGSRPRGPMAVGFLCMALIVPMAAQSLLFPFNYTFFNPVVALTGGVDDRWEADYRWTSKREAFKRVPQGVWVRCAAYLAAQEGEPVDDIEYDDCDGDSSDIAREDRGTEVAPGALSGPRKIWVLGRYREGRQPPPYCEEFDNVTRPLWGETVTISYVLRCDPERIVARERTVEREDAEDEAGEG